MMRRTLPGPFSTEEMGRGRWRLMGLRSGTEVYLQTRAANVAGLLTDITVIELDLQWTAAGVDVAVTRERGIERLAADSVIVHEPGPRLDQVLPLAGFDAKARGFWRRVFIVMRLPGGRMLLRFLTRK